MNYKILAINPGSTSTKIAVFENLKEIFVSTIRYSLEELSGYENIVAQFDFRRESILKALKDNSIALENINVIVGRGGLVKPIESGVYEVNEAMLRDLKIGVGGQHASNLGGIIAHDLAKDIKGCKAYIADPVVVDELLDVARVSGHPLFERKSIFHALNQKTIARKYAESINSSYEKLNLIVAHLGGGVSVGAHNMGRVIDVNDALGGEGPFSPERSGTLPASDLAKLCFSGNYSLKEIQKMIVGEGGLIAYFGTNSFQVVAEKVAEGDAEYVLLSDAFAYNVAKSIGAAATVLSGNVDAILITGGIAHGAELVENISKRTRFIAPVKVYPGEDEMAALAENGYNILTGKANAKVYV